MDTTLLVKRHHSSDLKENKMNDSWANRVLFNCGCCLLWLLHSIYSVYNNVLNHLTFILLHVKKMHSRTNFFKSGRISVDFLKEEIKHYPKMPNYVAVIIEEADISYHDCVKLILWCIHSGIPFISFYSFNGAINPTSLYEVLCKRSKSSLQNIKWGSSFHRSVKEMAKKDINGYVWSPAIEVNLFSSKSVYDSFENVLLRLCQQGKPEDISIETVDNMFKEEIPLPDPCLAFVFGKTFSTFGFMPWQIRVTEFVHKQTHHNLHLEDFISALHKYAFCQQRFGK